MSPKTLQPQTSNANDTVARQTSGVGLNGASAAPPSYGIDFLDRHRGQPNRTGLPDQLKTGIENLSGMSLDNVRIHYNSDKPAQLQALAYTQGTDIHVGPGQEKHLAHEAWHVVQQAQSRVKPTLQMKGVPVNDDAGLEREADVMGERARLSGFEVNVPIQPKMAKFLSQGQQVLQGVFILTKSYIALDNIPCHIIFEEAKSSTMEKGCEYRVIGFDFKGNTILYDAQHGYKYAVPRNKENLFGPAVGQGQPAAAAAAAGQGPSVAADEKTAAVKKEVPFIGVNPSGWQQQIFENGCWLATMAVLAGKSQQDIQKQLGWKNDAFYGIGNTVEIKEFAQMIKNPVQEAKCSDADEVLRILSTNKPIMIGVPGHAMILFAISPDKTYVKIWDPANGSIQTVRLETMQKQLQFALYSK